MVCLSFFGNLYFSQDLLCTCQWRFEEDVFQYSEHFTLQICEMTETVRAAAEGEENSFGMEEQREI